MNTLKDFIETHGSQDRAARALGVSQGFLCRVLQGKRALSLSQALRFETEHSVDATAFVSEDARDFLSKSRAKDQVSA